MYAVDESMNINATVNTPIVLTRSSPRAIVADVLGQVIGIDKKKSRKNRRYLTVVP